MALFHFKKKEENAGCCASAESSPNPECCGREMTPEELAQCCPGQKICVKVLGTGCAKCDALERMVKEALLELELSVPVVKVTDFMEIASYGVMSTPALVVNGQVLSSGRVLPREEVLRLLKGSLQK